MFYVASIHGLISLKESLRKNISFFQNASWHSKKPEFVKTVLVLKNSDEKPFLNARHKLYVEGNARTR